VIASRLALPPLSRMLSIGPRGVGAVEFERFLDFVAQVVQHDIDDRLDGGGGNAFHGPAFLTASAFHTSGSALSAADRELVAAKSDILTKTGCPALEMINWNRSADINDGQDLVR